jgi:outer membrane protein OmpA-like peptidoglycan-associated protein
MTDAPRLSPMLALAAAAALAGCTTPHVTPKLSQAVIDARQHRDAPAAPACPTTPLAEMTPVQLGFGFDESTVTEPISQALAGPTRWLACHPTVAVLIRPDADGHGTDDEQDALARGRAELVRNALTAKGIAPDRIRLLRRGEAEPAGEHLLIRAEGRRW